MATVDAHYQRVLAEVYSWMYGGYAVQLEKNSEFFERHDIKPRGSGLALDLGAGCGFQSIPLATLGFSVIAVDTDRRLLDELEQNLETGSVRTVHDDLMNLDRHAATPAEVAVCMTDTLLHLESREKVEELFAKVHSVLEDGGRFIITFRDLSAELSELDRFIPVRNDESTVFTCFLEYEAETVKVHDLVYRRNGVQWDLAKSFYRKLRLAPAWVVLQLEGAGFSTVDSSVDGGFVTVVARKSAVS